MTTDPLFTGIGWCWANNILNEAGFNVETVLGLTPSPSTILGSSNSTFVAANAGLTATSSGRGDMPIFFVGGGAQNFLILANPLTTDRILTLLLYDPDGVPLGPPLVRPLTGRGMQVLSVPQAFGVFPLRPSGSVTMAANGNGYLGWIVQVQPPTTLLFTAIGLKVDDLTLLTRPSAP